MRQSPVKAGASTTHATCQIRVQHSKSAAERVNVELSISRRTVAPQMRHWRDDQEPQVQGLVLPLAVQLWPSLFSSLGLSFLCVT